MSEQTIINMKQLQLGDTVQYVGNHFPFKTQVVKQIKDDVVTFFRPYVHTADFSYTGGVICYIGIEEYQVPVSAPDRYVLLERKSLR